MSEALFARRAALAAGDRRAAYSGARPFIEQKSLHLLEEELLRARIGHVESIMINNESRLILPLLIGELGYFVIYTLAERAGKWPSVKRRQFLAKLGALNNGDRFCFSCHGLFSTLP